MIVMVAGFLVEVVSRNTIVVGAAIGAVLVWALARRALVRFQ